MMIHACAWYTIISGKRKGADAAGDARSGVLFVSSKIAQGQRRESRAFTKAVRVKEARTARCFVYKRVLLHGGSGEMKAERIYAQSGKGGDAMWLVKKI